MVFIGVYGTLKPALKAASSICSKDYEYLGTTKLKGYKLWTKNANAPRVEILDDLSPKYSVEVDVWNITEKAYEVIKKVEVKAGYSQIVATIDEKDAKRLGTGYVFLFTDNKHVSAEDYEVSGYKEVKSGVLEFNERYEKACVKFWFGMLPYTPKVKQ